MDFTFEKRRSSGTRGPLSEPDFAAVRITAYHDKHTSKIKPVMRLRFAFSSKAVVLARWIKGDRLEVGGDSKNMLLAFKRSNAGYIIVGKAFSDKSKDRACIQVTVEIESPVCIISSLCLNEWIPLNESGLLLIASVTGVKECEK